MEAVELLQATFGETDGLSTLQLYIVFVFTYRALLQLISAHTFIV